MSRGTAKISFPANKMCLKFDEQIVRADVPILISLEDMDRMKVYLNNTTNKVVHVPSGITADVIRTNGHPFVLWNPTVNCIFTEGELRRLQRRFRHLSSEKLVYFLKCTELGTVD